jgi:hypothetical protein
MSDHYLSPAPGIKAAMCATCKSIKPLAEFKRRLSRAQARARGYSGSVILEIESSMCKTCQPRTKGLTELTAKEINNRVVAGDLYVRIANAELEKRKTKATINRQMAAKKAWTTAKTAPWAEVMAGLRKELASTQQQEKHVKTVWPDLDLTFFLEYKLVLTQTRERIKFVWKGKGLPPQHMQWENYIEWEERLRIKRLWEAMPSEYRKRARLPSLATFIPPPEERTPPKVSTLAKDGSPKARLERVKAMREAGVPMPPPAPLIQQPEIVLPQMQRNTDWSDLM